MTLRSRLTLLVAVILTIIFVVLGNSVYFLMERYLTDEIDHSLASRAQEVIRSIKVESNLLRQQRINLPDVNVFSTADIFLQIVDIDGFVVTKSYNLGYQALPLDHQTLHQSQKGISFFENRVIGNTTLRLYNIPLLLQNQPVGILQVARILSPLENTLANLRRVLFFLGLIFILIATSLGYFLARAALQPIEHLTLTAERIEEGSDLKQRVPYTGPMDEIGRLTATFNAMLGRLEKAYIRLEEAYKAQRRFLADVSHELRTPLTTIRGNVDLLQKMKGTEIACQEEALTDIASEAERMSRQVNNLLTLARAEAGVEISREPVEILPLLQEVSRQAVLLGETIYKTQGLEDLAGRKLLGNSDYIKQLCLILLDNAFKYTPVSGQVELKAMVKTSSLIIEVKDTGPGIAPEDLQYIFERFYRSGSTRSSGGTGLGLPIARWIVEQHQGQIKVESIVGEGSTFIVSLPLIEP